jgi:hypothetical protein
LTIPDELYQHLNGSFDRLDEDNRVNAYHISLYLALFRLWNLNRFAEKFPVNRTELMIMSRINSVNTYARCMKELDKWGYIRYSATANRHSGSEVSCIRFDTGNNISNNTGSDIGSNTGNDTGDDTLYKRINNTKDKQEPPKNFHHGERKKTNGYNWYFVNNNKDYSEPL